MRILLIHQNFPGQFRDLAPAWIQQGHHVWGVGCTEPNSFQSGHWRGLRYTHYQAPAGEWEISNHLKRGARLAGLLQHLQLDQGMQPDVVLAHSGWGEALHLRRVFPEARLIVLPELWGTPQSLGEQFDSQAAPLELSQRCRLDQLNLPAAAAIATADAAVTATQQQRDSFPPLLRSGIHVIHEGVDCDRFTPSANANLLLPDGQLLDRSDPVISFASRHLEPLRGLRPFLEALPVVLEQHPRVQVLIAGSVNGGYGLAPLGESHLADVLGRLSTPLDHRRVHLLGKLPHQHLQQLFQISRVHVYLSYPYALSWSVLEAMACGTPIISNQGGPAAEVIRHRQHGLLVPFNQPSRLAKAILTLLNDPTLGQTLGAAARRRIHRRYSLQQALVQYQDLFKELDLITSCTTRDPNGPEGA